MLDEGFSDIPYWCCCIVWLRFQPEEATRHLLFLRSPRNKKESQPSTKACALAMTLSCPGDVSQGNIPFFLARVPLFSITIKRTRILSFTSAGSPQGWCLHKYKDEKKIYCIAYERSTYVHGTKSLFSSSQNHKPVFQKPLLKRKMRREG